MIEQLGAVELSSLKNILYQRQRELEEREKDNIREMHNLKDGIKDAGDIASFEINSERLRVLMDRTKGMKYKITNALQRIVDGEYGLCQECSCPIGARRLFFDPTTDLCLDCKSELENERSSA